MRNQFPAHGPIEEHVHHLANVTFTPAGKWQAFDPQFDSEWFYVRDGAISPFGPDLAPDPTQISEPSDFSLGQCLQDVTFRPATE